MSEWNGESYLPWYRRPTATWLELSAAARGVLVSVAMELNHRTGRLTLRKGLPSLAIILRIPWEVLEPALGELIAAEKLVWDGSKFELYDPEHEQRRVPTSRERVARYRARKAAEPAPPLPAPSPREEETKEKKREEGNASNVGNVTSVTETPRPEWFDSVCERVMGDTGERFGIPEAWIRYGGHRKNKAVAMNANDASYWLGTVMVPEARRERQARSEREQGRRDRYAPPEPPKVSREQAQREAKAFADRLLEAKRKAVGT